MPRAALTHVPRTSSASGTAEHSNGADSVPLTASALRSLPDNQMVSFLFNAHRTLRGAAAPYAVDKAALKELLSARFLKSEAADVSQMVACILCDVLRLSMPQLGDGTSTSVSLPFPLSACDDIVQCMLRPFQDITSSARGNTLQKCEYIIARLCASRAMLHLLPHCHADDLQTRLTCLFLAVKHANSSTEGNGKSAAAASVSTVTAAEMARVIVDVLMATGVVTEGQLQPLLSEVVAASPALRAMSSSAIQPAQKSSSAGANIAARVLLEHIDVLQPAVASLAMASMERGAEQVVAADITGDKADGKRSGLRDISKALEILVSLTELNVNLVAQLVPSLLPFLQNDQPDVRLLTLRGFCAAFVSNESAFHAYRPAFLAAMSRFSDIKPALRIEVIQQAAKIMQTAAKCNWSAPVVEGIWGVVRPLMDQRLTDANVSVRREAVQAYCEALACTPPSLIANQDKQLAASLGLRTADKNGKVRDTAVEKLSLLYRAHLLPWIPDAIMNAINAEDGARSVETSLESMLPHPAQGGEGRGSSSRHTSPRGSVGPAHRRTAGASLAMFDFEKEDLRKERSYVDAFVQLCSDLSPRQYTQLLAMMKKKPQLRLAIAKLFELRAEIKTKDPKSSEGQVIINNIHRLLSFLQNITGAVRGEWDALFRAKDDRIGKAFLQACQNTHHSWGTERDTLLLALKGRIDSDVFSFVENVLVKQMMLVIDSTHVEELLQGLIEEKGSAAVVSQKKLMFQMRALLVFISASPASLSQCTEPLLQLLGAVVSQGRQQPADADDESSSTLHQYALLLLHALKDWAASMVSQPQREEDAMHLLTKKIKHEALSNLGRMCMGSVPALVARGSDYRLLAKVSKQSARCFLGLISIPEFGEAKALATLLDSLRAHLHGREKLQLSDPRLIAWVHAIRAFAQDPLSAPLVQEETLLEDLSGILLTAASDRSDAADKEKVKRHAADVKATTAAMALHWSSASAVVEGTAKAMVALVQGCSADRRPGTTSAVLDVLLRGYKASCEMGPQTVGACQRRLAISKQLIKVLQHPSSDIGKELAVSVLLSSEDEVVVRQSVQAKLTSHLLRSGCDMRYAAFLFLTAMGEESKSSYHELRTMVQSVGDHFRAKQTALGISLSTPAALRYYLEYTIPFLILFMAHHPLYDDERDSNQFTAFQRVWHLLYDELCRHGTQCAAFVTELLSRIKQSDDVLSPHSDATRVLCDLGSKVLLEVLGQRQMATDTLKRYPGAVLLPSFFVRTAHPNPLLLLDTVFIDASVHIAANPPFRAPARDTNNNITPRESVDRDEEEKGGAYTPYGVMEATPAGRSARRRSARADSVCSAASSSHEQQQRRARTEPYPAAAAASEPATTAQALVCKRLDCALSGLSKEEIVKLKWKALRAQLEADLTAAGISGDDTKDAMEYAKDQLRIRYNQK